MSSRYQFRPVPELLESRVAPSDMLAPWVLGGAAAALLEPLIAPAVRSPNGWTACWQPRSTREGHQTDFARSRQDSSDGRAGSSIDRSLAEFACELPEQAAGSDPSSAATSPWRSVQPKSILVEDLATALEDWGHAMAPFSPSRAGGSGGPAGTFTPAATPWVAAAVHIAAATDSPEVINPVAGSAASRGIPDGPVVQRGSFSSVQVNVNADGNNIPGDAANEPSIAVDPSDPSRIAIGWRQFDSVASNFREAGYGFSSNGGQSFSFPGVLVNNQFRSDPVLASSAEGTFYYYSLSSTTSSELFRSTNGGATWSGPISAFGGDKTWMAVDTTSGIGSGNIYTTWQRFFSCCGDGIFTRSSDGGTTFDQPVPVPESPLFGTLNVAKNGDVYLAGVRGVDFQDFDTFVIARSSNAEDPAATPVFEHATIVDMGGSLDLGVGPNPSGLLGQVWVATDPSEGPTAGNIYMLSSVNPPGDDPMDVMFSRSSDRGVTWSPPIRVNDDAPGPNAWQWFGTLSVAPDGRIDVVWNDTRASGQPNLNETYMSYSLDGGQNWSTNVPITPQWNSFLGFPSQNKIGDYYHMVSDDRGAHLAFAATFTGGQDVYYQYIAPDCNRNGIHDGSDILTGRSRDRNGDFIPDKCVPIPATPTGSRV